MPMTSSDSNDVPRERRKDSRPSPFHIASSISDFSPGVERRSRYQPVPPTTPATSSGTTRRRLDTCSTPDSRSPAW